MTEKAYKAMGFASVLNLVVGIVLILGGLGIGVLAIINSVKLQRAKYDLTF